MSRFDDFGRLQDNVSALMGDFGRRSSLGGRRRGQGLWDDFGFDDPFMSGFGLLSDPFESTSLYTMPLLQSGTPSLRESRLKQGDEVKMSDEGGASSQTQLTTRPAQLPVMRCRVNVEDAKEQYAITAEVPGFDKQNLKVNINDNNVLTISGEQKQEHVEESKDKKYLRTERFFGTVQRTLQLPKNINKDGVKASYENGILHIAVPKAEAKEMSSTVQIE